MGVEGAAWATIISQFVTFLMNLLYLKKLKNITLNHEARKYSFSVSKRVMMLGISSFIIFKTAPKTIDNMEYLGLPSALIIELSVIPNIIKGRPKICLAIMAL